MLLWHPQQKPSPCENMLPSCRSHSKTNVFTKGESCHIACVLNSLMPMHTPPNWNTLV